MFSYTESNFEISKTLDYLFSLRRFGMRFDLRKMFDFLETINNPQNNIKTIHIAGTNGKGSTASFIASILYECGFKVGLYTSPHLSEFNERIVINGNKIENEYIIDFVEKNKDKIDKYELTFFDITTALAFDYFASKQVDYAVIETGLGGRLDSTNVINPVISVLTSISLDHQDILGKSLTKITREKGGIIKENKPVVLAKNKKIVKNIISKICENKNSELIYVPDKYPILKIDKKNLNFQFEIKSDFCNFEYKIRSPLFSDFQIDNVCNSIATCEKILNYEIEKLSKLADGISNLQNNFPITGRFQLINKRPIIIIDTSHNSDAIKKVLYEFRKIKSKKKFGLFGIMKDKNISDVLPIISGTFDKIFVCNPDNERALKSNELFKRLNAFKNNVTDAGNVKTAVEKINDEINEQDSLLVFGSNYLIAEYLDVIKLKKLNFQQII